MKNVPNRHPETTALAIHIRLPPSAPPTTPVATVARFASPENQTGHASATPSRGARTQRHILNAS